MLDKIIYYSFAALFFFVPLIFSPLNFELFEFNKMFLTYGLTVVIVSAWLLKVINHKSLIINRTPLDIPLLLFLGANILSTIFSIDTHTSVWGYYSRLNGGLLSTISYILLYFCLVSNISKEQIFKLLKIALISGTIIAIWGILEHFGVSLSCVILRGAFNVSCWVQDVQARVFATLGQPNWMAAYLAMLIFPVLYFFLTAKNKLPYYLLLTTYYLSFTFTYSRGATLGLITGLVIFLVFSLKYFKKLILVILMMAAINLMFGSALTDFKLVQKFSPPPRPTIVTSASQSGTQLETGGTESGQIRLIVWQGALDIFKNYPIFGSGVETFAYSYYQFRPVAHNLTSEWDFLYNKAHNEYLNYLANTGIVGLSAYMIIIITFIIVILKKRRTNSLLLLSLLAGYISYLVQNIFGFSVVIIALFFFLFPALTVVATNSIKPVKILKFRFGLVYKIIIIFAVSFLLFTLLKFWYADTMFAKGMNFSESSNPGQAYNYLFDALVQNPKEPYYQSELGYSAAVAALALQNIDATFSAYLKDRSVDLTEKVLSENSHNLSYLKTAIRTYFAISGLDQTYSNKTIMVLDKAISLSPTDPKLFYNKALILFSMNKKDEAILALNKALELKPNYQEAREQLDEINK